MVTAERTRAVGMLVFWILLTPELLLTLFHSPSRLQYFIISLEVYNMDDLFLY
jgi:hypothetical protein